METYTVRSINKSHLGWHPNMGGDVVEWLYMDGWMDNGYKYGVTLASKIDQGEMFGEQGNWPFVMAWLTSPDGETLTGMNFLPVQQYKEEKPWGVTIGNNVFKGSLKKDGQPAGYHMKVTLENIGIDITAKAVCSGMRIVEEKHGYMHYDPVKDTAVGWWPLVPRASVKGTITFQGKEVQVTGLGYCERQLGNKQGMLMTDWLSHWFWGHCFAGDYTASWAYTAGPENKQYRPFSSLVLWKGSDVILSTNNPSVSPDKFEIDDVTGRYYAVAETIHATEGNMELFILMSTPTINEKLPLPGKSAEDPGHVLRGFSDIDVQIRRLDRWEQIKGKCFHEQGQIIPWIPAPKPI